MEFPLNKCLLREWRVSDAEAIAHHANNRRIWRNLRDRFPHPYTLEDAHHWIEFAAAESPQLSFAITVNNEAVGGIGLSLGQDIERRSAEIGYWLGEEFWGRGIVTEAVQAVTEYGFTKFDLCRIWASVFAWNPASGRVLEKAGFVREAILRKSATKDGQTIDTILYAQVRE